MAMEIEPRLSVAQLAQLWGCSRQHVYSLIEKGHLRAVRIGSLIRLRPDDVRDFETRQCRVQGPTDRNSPSRAEDAGTMSSGGKMVAHAGFRAGLKSLRKRGGS
jgi:excisionase family DNA binding protein